MTISKQPRIRSTSRKMSIGLAAIGSSGSWEIAIDQTTSGRDRWFVQIESPSVYLYFEIPSVEVIDSASEFLRDARGLGGDRAFHAARGGSLALGSNKSTLASLERDREFKDRCFLVLETKGGPLVRFTLSGNDLVHVTEALRQIRGELDDS